MSGVIIYGSKYGTTKQYAQELATKTSFNLISYQEISHISSYDTVIFLGGLYAGGTLGLATLLKQLPPNPTQNIIIVTVGLADPTVTSNTDRIKEALCHQLPAEVFDRAQIFHLRGGIDYKKLNLVHRMMMRLLYNKVKKTPIEKQSDETKSLIETYNQHVDFVNLNDLEKIINVIS